MLIYTPKNQSLRSLLFDLKAKIASHKLEIRFCSSLSEVLPKMEDCPRGGDIP
jgi:hypothetical protein